MIITAAILVMVLLLMIGESLIINSCVNQIGVKIHVNGTRGKSSITKYIYAGIKEDHLKVLAKITGEIPTLYKPDGSHSVIKRRGSARVQEQFNILRKAKKEEVDAMVLECMSIDPVLQKLESSFYKPCIYVICNIRDDHREKMGDTFEEQLQSICSAIPKNSKVIAGDSDYVETIKKYTKTQNSKFINAISLTEAERNLIPKTAHEINVQLALTACIEAGISRDKAFKGILKQIDSEGSPLYPISQTQNPQYFLNAFSVNDIASVHEYLEHWTSELKIKEKLTVVFNTRSDRPLRTGLFIDWIKSYDEHIEKVILIGDHKLRAHRLLKAAKQNINTKIIRSTSKHSLNNMILENAANSKLIVGIGNIKGHGYQIINEFSKAS